ncbi:MAG TPA: DinB family protein [Candidatus Limnocylindria bacterium]|nr:DinB family protein [Candidatus Limnocylindria bacterium]
MQNDVLVRLFEHNNWANDTMLAACGGLSDEQLAVAVPGTYGPLGQILIHLARAQGGYLRRLTDWTPGPEHRLEYEEPFPGVERVLAHLRFTGQGLVDVASEFDATRVLEFEYEGEIQRLPAWVVLLQAPHHATEHRQQVATALTHLGLEPPEPDLWAYEEALRR